MKKIDLILLTIVLVFVVCIGCSQSKLTLTGYAIFDKVDGQDSVLVEKKIYNDNFELVEETNYNYYDDKVGTVKFTYDKNKKPTFIDGRNNVFNGGTTEYVRNSNGDLEKEISIHDEEKRTNYYYNEYLNGKLVKTTVDDYYSQHTKNEPKSFLAYFYDVKGNLINIKHNSSGKIIGDDYYKYDSKGNKIVDSSATENTKVVYFFNDKNQIIKEESYQRNNLEKSTETQWEGNLPTKKTITNYLNENYKEVIVYKKEI